MAYRLTVMEKGDLTTVRVAGRLADDAVTPLTDACRRARRPLVVDLSQVTGASSAAVLLLRRLVGEGVHLLGASQYLTLLLAAEDPPAIDRSRRRRLRPRRAPGRAQRNPQGSR
jgi:ABC-type transporter Mla MlaB component